jgi:hypothetical protein
MASRRVLKMRDFVCALAAFGMTSAANGYIATFDDLPLAAESYWNGSDGSGAFASGGAHFNNNYDTMYGSWDGFSYSNITDTAADGMAGQFNAITGVGHGGSANYGVSYVGWAGPPTITLDATGIVEGLYVTNNNSAYYSMLKGDLFAKKFGGAGGDEPDWFVLTITGKDAGGAVTDVVEFYLADYRFADNGEDYIVDAWEYVDLSALGVVKSLEFGLSSSDVGAWGMNTPAYFAIDSLVPEPGTIALLGLGGLILARRKK